MGVAQSKWRLQVLARHSCDRQGRKALALGLEPTCEDHQVPEALCLLIALRLWRSIRLESRVTVLS